MADETDLSGPESAPASGGPPDRLIVFLHGVGADGNDLIALAPVLSQVFPDAHFLAPDGPDPCDVAPSGRQWFSLREMERDRLAEGLDAVTPKFDAYLDRQMARFGLTPDRVAVFGFSQGTMLALHAVPRRAQPIAGILGYSGMLVAPEALGEHLGSRPPTLLIHGEDDPVVPVNMSKISGDALKIAGFDVEVATCSNLGHSIDEAGLKLGVAFLQRAFKDVDDTESPTGHAPA
jgi:phospholipase/carboxylesterase